MRYPAVGLLELRPLSSSSWPIASAALSDGTNTNPAPEIAAEGMVGTGSSVKPDAHTMANAA